MNLIESTLLENKFALANFILLNEKEISITRDQLYVIQLIESYQQQFSTSIDFDTLAIMINFPIKVVKNIILQLQKENMLEQKLVDNDGLKSLMYETKKFWINATNLLINFENEKTKENRVENIIDNITNAFGRFLNPNEVEIVEKIINLYDDQILNEIISQCVILDSKYVTTLEQLVNSYKDSNAMTLEDVTSLFEQLRA